MFNKCYICYHFYCISANTSYFCSVFLQTHIQTSGMCGISIAHRVGELAAKIVKISHIAIGLY